MAAKGGANNQTLTTASQGYAFITSTLSHQTGRYYTLSDSTGKNLLTYSLDANVNSSNTLFTVSGMEKGSTYSLKYGTKEPSDASTAFHGIYIGSNIEGTTAMTSFTAK